MAPPPKQQSLDAMAVLNLGLRFIGANDRERGTKLTTRITRFRTFYGSHPLVYSKIWDDLWLYQIDDERKIGYFFLSLHFLKEYDKESVLGLTFHRDEETVRDWCWYYAECIQMLKSIKVSQKEC
jgi:hypothetical protein